MIVRFLRQIFRSGAISVALLEKFCAIIVMSSFMVVSVWIFLHLNASRATLTTGEIGGALMMLACHAVLTRSVCLYVEEFGDIVRLKGR